MIRGQLSIAVGKLYKDGRIFLKEMVKAGEVLANLKRCERHNDHSPAFKKARNDCRNAKYAENKGVNKTKAIVTIVGKTAKPEEHMLLACPKSDRVQVAKTKAKEKKNSSSTNVFALYYAAAAAAAAAASAVPRVTTFNFDALSVREVYADGHGWTLVGPGH